MSDGPGRRRRPEMSGPTPSETGWLALDDDEILYRIESLPLEHAHEADLLDVVRSQRHFFVRQEAAKRIRDAERLKSFAGDRHIGQILVRQMTRADDAGYLKMLLQNSRHIEVRNAAAAQLRLLDTDPRPRPESDVSLD